MKMKRIYAFALALLLILPFAFSFGASADDAVYLFIDGINITRQANMAVIYNGGTTGQTKWGFDVIISSADGKISKTVAAGEGDDDLTVPPGYYVISATGEQAQWLKANAKIGKYVYYDPFSQRAFITAEKDKYDPYFTKTVTVYGEDGEFVIKSEGVEGVPQYHYTAIADSSGMIISRGSGLKKEEGQISVSAATDEDMKTLIMYALIGGECKVEENTATFTFDSAKLLRGITIALDNARNSVSVFSTLEDADALLDSAEEMLVAGKITYAQGAEMISYLEGLAPVLASDKLSELRAAFYTPKETSDAEVEATVKLIKESGLNAIILKVSNGYGTAAVMPEESVFSQDSSFEGFDVIAAFVEKCKAEEIEVDICLDVYYNEYAAVAAPEWLSSPAGDNDSTSSKFFSPADDNFKAYFIEYLKNIITRYDINGLMLDYLRYPKFSESGDIGYDDKTIDKFCAATGITYSDAMSIRTELYQSEYWSEWVEFRKGLITDMAKSISETVREYRGDIILTAIAAKGNIDYYYMQNYTVWLTENIVDGVCLALYDGAPCENDSLPLIAYGEKLIENKSAIPSAYAGKTKFCFIGLNTNASVSALTIEKEVIAARSIGSDGVIFSSFEDYIAQGYSLNSTLFINDAATPSAYSRSSAIKILERAEEKALKALRLDGTDDENTVNSVKEAISNALNKLEESALTYEEASALEAQIAMLFAKSNYKSEVVSDFAAITKSALIVGSRETDDPLNGTEQSEGSDESEVSHGEFSVSENSESENQPSESFEEESEEPIDIPFGSIAAYTFVSLAVIGFVIGTVIGIKRRKKPRKRYLLSGNNDEE